MNSNQPSLFLTFKCLGSGKLKQSLPRLVSELDKLSELAPREAIVHFMEKKQIFTWHMFFWGSGATTLAP